MLDCLFSFSQNTPYLNANRGNYRECAVDKDTNIYVFRVNQLEKYNKNLQAVWVKQFDSLQITNLLLSKTNTLFFISGNKVGKMDLNGNISWCKKLSATCNNMMLNYQNNLVIATSQGLFKMDTLGNVIYCKKFNINYSGISSVGLIINDSMGVYEFITNNGSGISNSINYKFKYSEILDSVVSIKTGGIGANIQLLNIHVSNHHLNTIYLNIRNWVNGAQGGGPSNGYVEKIVGDSVIYSIGYNNLSTTYPYDILNNFSDDKYGNLYYTQSFRADQYSSNSITFGYPHHLDVYKVDSTGNNTAVSRLLDDVSTPPLVNTQTEIGTFNNLYNNTYLFSYMGSRGFTINHPVLIKLDSIPKTMCSLSSNYPHSNTKYYYHKSIGVATSTNTAYSAINQSIITTTVNDFIPDTNYCISIGIEELNSKSNSITFYPNPVNEIINIEFATNEYEATIIEITNTLGQILYNQKAKSDKETVAIKHLQNGIYYLSIKTKYKKSTVKLIKE